MLQEAPSPGFVVLPVPQRLKMMLPTSRHSPNSRTVGRASFGLREIRHPDRSVLTHRLEARDYRPKERVIRKGLWVFYGSLKFRTAGLAVSALYHRTAQLRSATRSKGASESMRMFDTRAGRALRVRPDGGPRIYQDVQPKDNSSRSRVRPRW